MARIVQDQNLNIHSAGSLAAMFDASKTAKKAPLGGRKALNDISNSSKLSKNALKDISNSSKLSKNAVSKGKDFITVPPGPNVDKVAKPKAAPVKGGQQSGRKVLGDLTNTNFPRSTTRSVLTTKMVQDKKLTGIMEDTIVPNDVKGELFLHNHEACIKGTKKSSGMQFKHFMETVGLGSPLLVPQASNYSRAESPVKMISLEKREIPEFSDKDQLWAVYSSPPKSSMTPFDDNNWKITDDYEATFTEFQLIESPKLLHNY